LALEQASIPRGLGVDFRNEEDRRWFGQLGGLDGGAEGGLQVDLHVGGGVVRTEGVGEGLNPQLEEEQMVSRMSAANADEVRL
jgi:hypothetical protein